jgi:activator of 2-hydroxyglutaryl-CoA dehydratase
MPESICIEAALRHLNQRPDLVVSLGGETFIAYGIANGIVRRMVASNRCAAGSGESLVQQFGRNYLFAGSDAGGSAPRRSTA